MKRRRLRGFTLIEFLVAIVFIGVVLGPFLVFVSRIHDLNNAVGQQGRREAWRSFNDQAVAAGIDPNLAPALATAANAAIPSAPRPGVTSPDVPAVPGLARIVPLQVVLDGTVAETRIAGSGLQIGAGAAVAPRSVPTPPLIPLAMPTPTVTPADGTVVIAGALVPAPLGAPYTIEIQAASAAGTRVTLQLNQPSAMRQALGTARQTVTAVDLLQRVSGLAWAEYAGSLEAGDRAAVLADGRTRWFVTRPDGRLQIYEPSSGAAFAYRLGLGAPVLVRGTDENTAGSTLAFDYSAYYDAQRGATPVRIDFPSAVKAVFGTHWGEQTIGFQATFNATAAPFSGDLQAFFLPDQLGLWADAVEVAAVPVVPIGAAAETATWTFSRTTTALGVPLLSSVADSAGFYSPGEMQFSAPNGPDGTAIGRLSFNHGANLSTGPTLSVSVLP